MDDTARAMRPVLVVTPGELEHYYRELLSPPAHEGRGYTEVFDWKKTDMSAGTAAAIVASRQILGGDVRSVGGWAVSETTGAAAAAVRLHDGNGAAGEVIARISVPSGGMSFVLVHGKGIEVTTGRVFLEVVSGSVEGVLFWR